MSSRTRTLFRGVLALALAGLSTTAFAQIQVNTTPANPSGVFQAFPAQNPQGPTGAYNQANYPYPGQCVADPLNAALFPTLGPCSAVPGGAAATSFAAFQRSAGTWANQTGTITTFKNLNPVSPALQTKFAFEVLNPPDYTPDTTSFPGADYYEIGVHEAWGTNAIAKAGLFPNPGAGINIPDGMQWTGLRCDNAAGCSCPADASATFAATFCNDPINIGKIPLGAPLFTPIWGIGQINNGGGPVTQVLKTLGLFDPAVGPSTAWSGNTYIATWPSISIRGKRGTPVVVKWVNEFPNTHVLCPHPEAADWPCAIDRTFMGVKAKVDPALPHSPSVSPEKVNRYGSPQQPDNSWVTHLHGGEIPPSTDGFAEKWFGNAVTAPLWTNLFVSPPFENPLDHVLKRPAGHSDTYTYPMVQEEATIWFHDHTLGKTHHNVIAGPAGFFPVKEPLKHGGSGTFAGTCPTGYPGCNNTYTWLDPVTEPRNGLGIPYYDLFFAIQDRSFNDDGSINFSNGLGQAFAAPDPLLPVGYSSVTPGVNPQVHPTWVPEYFGDHVLVNGALWPKFTALPGWYRIRLVDGSDSRCWTFGLSSTLPAPGAPVTNDVQMWLIGSDQGYLKTPVRGYSFTFCPGERMEFLVNFEGKAPGSSFYLTNSASAPYPAGIAPQDPLSPYADMNVIMRFDVVAALPGDPAAKPVHSCWPTVGNGVNNWNPNFTQAQMMTAIGNRSACVPVTNTTAPNDPSFISLLPVPEPTFADTIQRFPAGAVVRQMYLNERIDGVTLAPLGMQINGVPFEYKVTETPKKGTIEWWQIVNLTVDTHPMHPHFIKHQLVSRQRVNTFAYKTALCGSAYCQPGPVPGNEMAVVPELSPFLMSNVIPPTPWERGWKDALKVPPGYVTNIVADWTPRWTSNMDPLLATAPGTAGCPNGQKGCAAPYVYEDVTSGPYVWHCHINSHEDSEMMRTSMVVP